MAISQGGQDMLPTMIGNTALEESRYSFFSSAFSLNTEKYRPEKTPYVDTFHTV